MIRALTVVAGVLVTLASVTTAQQPQTFGDGVSLKEATAVARVLDAPADFEGKTIRVDGQVTAVCSHQGCWMSFASDKTADGRTLLIKVDDGVIVLPMTAKGRKASAQGVVQRIGSGGEAQEAAGEHAKQTGSSPVKWQLKATGAIVY